MPFTPLNKASSFTPLNAPKPAEPTGVRGVKGFGVGIVKSGLGTVRGMGELGTKILQQTAGRAVESLTGKPKEEMGADIYRPNTNLGRRAVESTTPYGGAEKFGKFTGDVAQYLAPTSKVVALGKGSSVFGRAMIEAGTTGSITAAQQGKVDKNVAINAGIAGLIPVVGTAYKAFRVPNADKIIDHSINKAVKPTVVGKHTSTQVKSYFEKARDAVKTIITNKDNIKLVDDDGVPKMLPTSLKEFSQAIRNTKEILFKQYDDLAQSAGSKGAEVSLAPVASELAKVADNKVLQDVAPDVAQYATTRARALGTRGKYTAEEAQEAVKVLNQSLEAFYKNQSYDTASRAAIDSMIVNNLRASLDDIIEKSAGSGYQSLKSQYGALKTIEKEVTHRTVVDARKNIKGLVDFTDIFSSGQVISGILTMNPGQIAQGFGQKGIATFIKSRNDPNRIVRKMFEQVDDIMNGATKTRTGIPARVFGSRVDGGR